MEADEKAAKRLLKRSRHKTELVEELAAQSNQGSNQSCKTLKLMAHKVRFVKAAATAG
jgi:hypothetical protein